MEPTREILWNAGEHARVIIYLLMVIPFALFIYGFVKRWRLWKMGKPEGLKLDRWGERIKLLMLDVLFHRRVLEKPYACMMHFLLFWGFIILTFGTTLIFVEVDITLPIASYRFLKGPFYLWFSLILDILGGLAIAGVILLFFRRYLYRPQWLDNALDDLLILVLFLVILLSGFLLEGLRILATELVPHPDWVVWSPV